MVAQVLHLTKTEKAIFVTQLHALLFETLKQKTQILEVFFEGAIVDTNIVEVNCDELVLKVVHDVVHHSLKRSWRIALSESRPTPSYYKASKTQSCGRPRHVLE
jgi:hypothetical protein